MLSRNVLRKCFAVIFLVSVLFGSFLVVKISSQVDAEAACNGRVPDNGQETPSVQEYCPGNDGLEYTWESAYFFIGHLPDGPDPVQKWYRTQFWDFDDDVDCSPSVTRNLPRENWDGYWAGSESKSRYWDPDIEEWLIYIYSRTLSYRTEKIDGEDFICPTWHQSLQVSEQCGNGVWHDFDPNVDFGQDIMGNGIQRWGAVDGQLFNCYPYPSDISF